MAASGQGGGHAARGVRVGADTLSRLLDDLCRPGALERRREGERALCEFVEAEARDVGADAFGKFMAEVYTRLHGLIKRCVRPAAPAPAPAAAPLLLLLPPPRPRQPPRRASRGFGAQLGCAAVTRG